MELDNGMTRLIAGSETDLFINRTPIGECTNDLLELAIANLNSHFSVVGITERFDESFLLLCHLMGWSNTYYLSKNRNNHNADREVVDQTIIEELEARNSFDRLLYEHAQKLLDQQIIESEILHLNKLENFQRRNKFFQQSYGVLHELYASAKHRLTMRDAPH